MKNLLFLSFFLTSTLSFSQSAKEDLFKTDVAALVEEMEFMYGYDKLLREYSFLISFDRSETERIENLSNSLGIPETVNRQMVNDSLATYIFKKYINPKDAENTVRMMAIIKKYGFPGLERIRLYYDKEFIDPEFTPHKLLLNVPVKHNKKLKKLLKKELKEGRINQCAYGELVWSLSTPLDPQILLDNGYIMEEKDGVPHFKPTCE